MIWLKIGLPLLILAGVWFAVKQWSATAEENGELRTKLATCQQANAGWDAENKELTERIKQRNADLLAQVQREEARVAEAKAEAERIKAQRDKAKADLAAARRDWQEAVNNDPNLAQFLAPAVPGAVWDRLRRASGG